ncbi:MAG: glycosyltransferase [Bacteroidales bacterium]|nr:glycosyltransferase [Bacteroidales bacterium]
MNILIYFGNQLNPQCGGTERVACIIAEYLQRQGHNLFYMACTPTLKEGSIETVFLPSKSETTTKENVSFVNGFIRNNKVDIIINEGGNTDSIYLFSHKNIDKRVKIITHLHFDVCGDIKNFYKSLYIPIKNAPFKTTTINIFKWIKAPYNKYYALRNKKARYKYMLDNTDKVVLLSKYHIIDYKRLVKNGDFSKLISITNPITFQNIKNIDSLKQNEIIFVGRLDYASKRVDRILKVWKVIQQKNRDWHITIVGDGTDKERLEVISKSLNLERITFAGHTDPEQYYQRAKILLMTSNFEGTPMVIPEAMAYGVTPIVMNSFVGVNELIQNGYNGILTKPFCVTDMANAVQRLIDNPNKLETIGKRGKITIHNMDNNSLLKEWNKIIN